MTADGYADPAFEQWNNAFNACQNLYDDDELEECMRDENGGVELVQLIDRDPELEERSRAGSETRGFPRPGTKRVNFRSGLFSDAGCWRVVVPALQRSVAPAVGPFSSHNIA